MEYKSARLRCRIVGLVADESFLCGQPCRRWTFRNGGGEIAVRFDVSVKNLGSSGGSA